MRKMTPGMSQSIRSDRLGLTDLLEISDLLLRSQRFRFRITSWSMYPALQKGDRLTVEPVSLAQLQVGDTIVFHDCGRLICHRLIAMEKAEPMPSIITKGDAMGRCDAPVRPDQVLGRVVGVRRSGSWLGSLAIRIDRWVYLPQRAAQGLLWLQGHRLYRQVMRALLSRCFTYSIGLPEGSQWYRYERVCSDVLLGPPTDQQHFHLVATLAGISAGSLRAYAQGGDYWLESLYVRTSFRSLGVALQLIDLASKVAILSEPRRLFAAVEQNNNAALRLFEKMGFREATSASSHSMIMVREIQAASSDRPLE